MTGHTLQREGEYHAESKVCKAQNPKCTQNWARHTPVQICLAVGSAAQYLVPAYLTVRSHKCSNCTCIVETICRQVP